MFLGKLNQRQKGLFIQLCIHAALANGIMEDEELILIEGYCKEMSIENPGMKAKISLEEVLSELGSNSSIEELNIIAFEVLAIFISDSDYTKDEMIFMDKLVREFDIDEAKVKKMINQIEKYNLLVQEIVKNLLE